MLRHNRKGKEETMPTSSERYRGLTPFAKWPPNVFVNVLPWKCVSFWASDILQTVNTMNEVTIYVRRAVKRSTQIYTEE